MENKNQIIIEKIERIEAQLTQLDKIIEGKIMEKAAYTQDEIIEAMGLSGKQKKLLSYMKKSKLLHSPINKSPLIYPAYVVKNAIEKLSGGKTSKK